MRSVLPIGFAISDSSLQCQGLSVGHTNVESFCLGIMLRQSGIERFLIVANSPQEYELYQNKQIQIIMETLVESFKPGSPISLEEMAGLREDIIDKVVFAPMEIPETAGYIFGIELFGQWLTAFDMAPLVLRHGVKLDESKLIPRNQQFRDIGKAMLSTLKKHSSTTSKRKSQ